MLTGEFPSTWKIGKICPVPKKGNSSSPNNFRPICLTSNLGKVVEAVVRSRVADKIDSFLPSNMFGFRKGKSTSDALTKMLDTIRAHRANGQKVAVLALDATAAFDTISHDVILKSLKFMGAGPKMLAWSKSFLCDCEYFVQIDSTRSSSWSNGNAGVGQGKKFSPDYYGIGTASQSFWCKIAESSYYADDGGDVVSGDSDDECQVRLQEVALQKVEWFKSVGLTLNIPKREVIGFGFTPKPINIYNQIISLSTSFRFLGLTIQNNLKWDLHVTNICNKLRWAAGRIRSEGHFLGFADKKILFNGWIMSTLHSNAIAYLPSISDHQLIQLQSAMNCGIRAVVGLPRKSSTSITDIREKHGILSVANVRDKCLMLEAYKNRNKFATLNARSRLNGPCTRSQSRGEIPHPIQKGQLGKMTSTAVEATWNTIPQVIAGKSPIRSKPSVT